MDMADNNRTADKDSNLGIHIHHLHTHLDNSSRKMPIRSLKGKVSIGTFSL
jgi:hypothetical protein